MLIRKTVVMAGVIGAVIIVGTVMLFAGGLKSISVLPETPYSNSVIKVSAYKGNNGWGYDVYVDRVLLIHQPHIPVVSGNSGFATEADARKVAELVVDKIRTNSLPPSLTIEDLKRVRLAFPSP